MDRNLLDYRASLSWEDLMFEEQRSKKPWKKVALAVFLCLAGAAMLITGICLWYNGPGQSPGEQHRICFSDGGRQRLSEVVVPA